MKLIIQIPCLDEEDNIGAVIDDLPKQIDGVDSIEILIIDDGSTDKTVEIAKAHGATHILSLGHCRGLARGFRAGIEECIRLGADIIVNTDGDNQYCADEIPALIRPILAGNVDFVVGVRDIASIEHFSPHKKILQFVGSWVVRQLSGTRISDVTSGFRAFSRDAALRLDLVTDYSHTIETIIALGKEREAIAEVPIRTNGKLRESRLFPSIRKYIAQCGADMIRIYVRYESLKTFGGLGLLMISGGMLSGGYYLVNRLLYDGRSFVALAFFSMLVVAGLMFVTLGFLGDSIACNRRMLSRVTRHVRENK